MIIIEKKEKMTIFRATNVVSSIEIIQQASQYLGNEPTDEILWDFSDASGVNINAVEMEGIANSIKKVAGVRKGRKVALVSSGSINIGLGKYFVAVAQLSMLPTTYKVFRDITRAKKWLKGDME